MKEEEMKSAAMELEMYKVQLENLKRQEEIIRYTTEEHMRARDTLLNLKSSKGGEKLLVPIGANCFIFAKIDEPDSVICSIGGDLATKHAAGEAIEHLDKKITELSDAGTKLAERMQEVESLALQLSAKIQKEYGNLQQ